MTTKDELTDALANLEQTLDDAGERVEDDTKWWPSLSPKEPRGPELRPVRRLRDGTMFFVLDDGDGPSDHPPVWTELPPKQATAVRCPCGTEHSFEEGATIAWCHQCGSLYAVMTGSGWCPRQRAC